MKTSELIGQSLNFAVTICEGAKYEEGLIVWYDEESVKRQLKPCDYSGDWSQGGPIIEREKIALDVEHGDTWRARFGRARITFDGRAHHYHHQTGPTPLIAALRTYVASKLGDEIEIPEELQDVR